MDYYIKITLPFMREWERTTEDLRKGFYVQEPSQEEALQRKAATIATVIKETKEFRQKFQESEDESMESQKSACKEITRLSSETAHLNNEDAALTNEVLGDAVSAAVLWLTPGVEIQRHLREQPRGDRTTSEKDVFAQRRFKIMWDIGVLVHCGPGIWER